MARQTPVGRPAQPLPPPRENEEVSSLNRLKPAQRRSPWWYAEPSFRPRDSTFEEAQFGPIPAVAHRARLRAALKSPNSRSVEPNLTLKRCSTRTMTSARDTHSILPV